MRDRLKQSAVSWKGKVTCQAPPPIAGNFAQSKLENLWTTHFMFSSSFNILLFYDVIQFFKAAHTKIIK